MRTSKPFSTISYNSDAFLEVKLNELLESFKIEYWCYVRHMGELAEDGTREKEHKHVLIIPNGLIDTMAVAQIMLEPDPSNLKKPLKCMDFRNSKEEEWFLYNSHDPDYLRTKFLVREFMYSLDDFVSSDEDETRIKWDRAFHESDYMKNQRMLKLMENRTASQMVADGFVTPQQAFQVQCYYNMLSRGRFENGADKFDNVYGNMQLTDADGFEPADAEAIQIFKQEELKLS